MQIRIGCCALCILFFGTNLTAQQAVTTNGGTVNSVSKFSGNATLVNSAITESNGKVGIGTTTPVTSLDVNGIISIKGIPVTDETSISTPADGTYVIASSARLHGEYILTWGESPNHVQTVHLLVNANQFDPWSTFQILENHSYDRSPVMTNFRLLRSADGGIVFLVMDVGNRNGGSVVYAQYQGSASYGSGFQGWTLSGNEVNGGSLGLASTDGGSVGIGTASPGAMLEVNGNIKLTANSGASFTFADGTVQSTAWTGSLCGGDYAESVNVFGDRTRYEPGDVLVLSNDNSSDVAKSTQTYSTSVAGIYSTKPGLIGRRQHGVKSDMEIPMAMVGIVPTKVSTENGPIKRGDLLVTSSTEGYAMKGTDHSRMLGAIVGKAMGSIESGRGVIEVLVSLQ